MKILIDTNVALDVLLKRYPFFQDSFVIFQLTDSGIVNGTLAAVSMTNIFYLLRKAKKNYNEAYDLVDELATVFTIATVNESTITHALKLRWNDFEDAVQYIAAKENNIDYIITRNESDFRNADIPCMSPTDFIAFLKKKEVIDQSM